MKTCGTLFAGCGGKTLGAVAAGFIPAWAIEYDPEIAEIYKRNISPNIYVRNILEINPQALDKVDLLLISPPCPNFSGAKANREETALDRAIAAKAAEFITVLRPQMVMVENVSGYRSSDSFNTLMAALSDYYIDVQVLNAADFGVPQRRRRLIVRASKEPLPLIYPTHSATPINSLFGRQKPHVGWYEAIADLMPSLPLMPLADWQIRQIKVLFSRDLGSGVRLVERSGAGVMQCLEETSPSFTIRAMGGKVRPNMTQANILLVAGGMTGSGQVCEGQKPAFTIRATPAEIHRVLKESISYRVTPQAIARLQSFPDSFNWSGSSKIDTRAIGNAVPPLLAQAVVQSFLGN